MQEPVRVDRRGPLAVVVIDNPPVNAVSVAVAKALAECVAQLENDPAAEAVVLHGTGASFVAGGDIAEFSQPDFDPSIFNGAVARLEALDKPVVAALHGNVLGAGLELALCAHYRVATPDARLGLPEVTLGLVPGSGGTQRLPRLVGPAAALEMIKSGTPIGAERAQELGLVDDLAAGDVLEAGEAQARELLERGAPVRRTGEMTVEPAGLAPDFFERAREEAETRKAAYPAHREIVRCLETATRLPLSDGLAVEAEAFEACRQSPESAALRHLFFAEREARKIPGVPADTPVREVAEVGVIGAGTMGTGIAMAFANAGFSVTVLDAETEALERGLAKIRKIYESSVAKGRLSQAEAESRQARIVTTLAYEDLAGRDLVIEAVFEDFELKKRVFAQLDSVCKQGAILATNTSTLDVDAIAQATGRPGDVLGMHFFSPANIMRLLEVVRGAATAPDVLATVLKLSRRINKVPVVAGVCYGFIGNRLIEPYMRETEFLLMEGASPSQIDAAFCSLGLAMGPCRMLDMAGVDVGAHTVVENRKAGGLPDDPSYRDVVQAMAERGLHGEKTGAGYYRYEGRQAQPNPDLERLCEELAARFGIARRDDITDQEIIERCLYSLINEGARTLKEGIAIRPGDIDLVYVHGYGFPDYRGGPMYMADRIGLDEIAARLRAYGESRGDPHGYWRVAPLLAELVAQGKGFADWTSPSDETCAQGVGR